MMRRLRGCGTAAPFEAAGSAAAGAVAWVWQDGSVGLAVMGQSSTSQCCRCCNVRLHISSLGSVAFMTAFHLRARSAQGASAHCPLGVQQPLTLQSAVGPSPCQACRRLERLGTQTNCM